MYQKREVWTILIVLISIISVFAQDIVAQTPEANYYRVTGGSGDFKKFSPNTIQDRTFVTNVLDSNGKPISVSSEALTTVVRQASSGSAYLTPLQYQVINDVFTNPANGINIELNPTPVRVEGQTVQEYTGMFGTGYGAKSWKNSGTTVQQIQTNLVSPSEVRVSSATPIPQEGSAQPTISFGNGNNCNPATTCCYGS